MVPEVEKRWEMFTHTDGRPYWFCSLERGGGRDSTLSQSASGKGERDLRRDRELALEQIAQLKKKSMRLSKIIREN